MVEPPIPAPATEPVEVAPPPLPSIFRKGADMFRAVPICRVCAVEHKITHLFPMPENRTCQVAKCENFCAYLAIL